MLSLMTVAIAFPMMHLATSPTPIGLTPGHLSRTISRLATKADIPLGSTKMEQIRFSVGISGMMIDEGSVVVLVGVSLVGFHELILVGIIDGRDEVGCHTSPHQLIKVLL